MTGKKIIWAMIAVVAAVVIALLLRAQWLRSISVHPSITIEGAVIQRDADTEKELPVAGVAITASDGVKSATTQSEASGYFKIVLQKGVLSGKPVTVSFRHTSYDPLDLNVQPGRLETQNELYIAAMIPVPAKIAAGPRRPEKVVSNIRVRYTTNSRTETNVGSAVKTFQVVNTGNVPCHGATPCSPDGKWKAELGSISMDAGESNEFRNPRVSCIAGPCPFTRTIRTDFSDDGRMVKISVLNWSDTATFLFEAEVYHPMVSERVCDSYPVIFGQALNFTLPPDAEGPSIEAELNGSNIVFPLGPSLCLSWANCNVRVDKEAKIYRCELKPGYRFR